MKTTFPDGPFEGRIYARNALMLENTLRDLKIAHPSTDTHVKMSVPADQQRLVSKIYEGYETVYG